MAINEDMQDPFFNELFELHQRAEELRLVQSTQTSFSISPEQTLTHPWFSTGRSEMFVSNKYLAKKNVIINSIKYTFEDLIDISLLQRFSRSFYATTGLPHAILDPDNNFVIGIGWQDICIKFHRACLQTACRCQQSDSYISAHLHDGNYVGYKCFNGLMDYAAPILLEGRHLATLFIGQLLHEPPDEEFFRRQAREYGFDEAAYIEALRRVPIISEAELGLIIRFYTHVSWFLSSYALDRKNQLDAISQSERKFTRLINCNPDLLSITTLEDGRYVEVNTAFVEITGYQRHEVLGRTTQELNIWADLAQRDRVIKEAREKGTVRNIELDFRMKSGEIRNFITAVEIIDLDGEEHLIVTTKDITDRIRTEAALRLSEECFSKAFNASPVSMTISTLEEGIFLQTNDAYCDIIGFGREEALGRTSFELGIWPVLAQRELVKEQIMANQSVKDMEFHFCRKTGEERLGLISAEGIVIDGRLCILSSVTDITDLRKMELEMTRLDRLNLVGEMAASIGHEIRNPLTAVRGYLQLLGQNEAYYSETESFNLMIEELDRANSIITEFLSLAKDKAVAMNRKSLNSIIKRALPLVQATAIRRDQHIKLELGKVPLLSLDKKAIRQLIINLVNNGLEAMPASGCVTIMTYREGERVVLAVQDEGPGIDITLLNNLYTPFFTTKDQGTGLGLSVCYRIATRHHAVIDLDTGSNGTTFYVKFPTNIPPA